VLETARTLATVRYRPGVVGETRRVSHLIVVEEQHHLPHAVTTRCGLLVRRGEADVLDTACGMPCERCLIGC
jgi:hypothetical protein